MTATISELTDNDNEISANLLNDISEDDVEVVATIGYNQQTLAALEEKPTMLLEEPEVFTIRPKKLKGNNEQSNI